MAVGECPQCGKTVSMAATVCKYCGEQFAPDPRLSVRPRSDAAKYLMIGGGVVAAILILLLVAPLLRATRPCADCRSAGTVICVNCKDGTAKCLVCKGSGRDPQNFSTCQGCKGKGTAAVCGRCNGTPIKTCPSCDGSGEIPQ